jgi:predicted dehydrogenase
MLEPSRKKALFEPQSKGLMKSSLNRRSFLKRSALAAGALASTRLWTGPNLLAVSGGSGNVLNVVQIGCGGRAMEHLDRAIARHKQHLAAIVDPDEKRQASVVSWLKKRNIDSDKLQTFTDYRVMFDKIGKQIDSVFIATPNHHHALPALIAMNLGKNVYCEKPVCHTIGEARQLREAARHHKVATQMGNQGHCEEGYHLLYEYIQAGLIGNVTETHSWTDRANGGVGPRPPSKTPPAGLHWDEWIGPAPYRDYHDDLHPHEWHGWYDFGNGSIGNMGCHILDGTFWALKVEHPTSIEMEEVRGGSDERYPTGSRIRWDIPARGNFGPFKAYWYEGLKQGVDATASGNLRTAKGDARNLPPLFAELEKQYPDEDFKSNGTLYVGDKGYIYTGCYGEEMHIVPWEKMKQTTPPPKTLPRGKDIFTDFIQACLEGRTNTAASFEYGTRLTEFTLLGNLAQYAGLHQKVEWNGAKMRITNQRELNKWVKRPYRTGWHV